MYRYHAQRREEVQQYLVGLIVDSYIDINHCLSDRDRDPNSNGEVSKNDHEDNSVEVSGSKDDEKCNSQDNETIKDAIEVSKQDITKLRWSNKNDDYVQVYAEKVLTLGMIYSEYSDAIKRAMKYES